MEPIKEFSVTITQEHIDRAVASNGVGNQCQCCVVWQAVAEQFPLLDIGVGLDNVWIEDDWYTPFTPSDISDMLKYTRNPRSYWSTSIPGKTIRFVLS